MYDITGVVVDIISFVSAESYYVAEENTDCPVRQTVNTVSECTSAAKQLGLNFEQTVMDIENPAGCYTWLHGGRQEAWFNAVLDYSSTYPERKTARICRSGNIN